MPDLAAETLESVGQRYYGKYKGFVADNEDPLKLGRVRLRVPSVLGTAVTRWALPATPYAGPKDQGMFFVPDVDTRVWVEFIEGDLNEPVWTGAFWAGEGDPPSEGALDEPTTRLIKTASGCRLQFDDKSGAERITVHHPTESSIVLDEEGSVAVTDKGGATVTLDAAAGSITVEDANGNSMVMDGSGVEVTDASGNRITMASPGITVKGTKVSVEGSQVVLGSAGGEPVIKGTSFLSLFATHVHTCTAPGSPSSPPIPQGEFSSLSGTVTSS